jgi:hypothetical protein
VRPQTEPFGEEDPFFDRIDRVVGFNKSGIRRRWSWAVGFGRPCSLAGSGNEDNFGISGMLAEEARRDGRLVRGARRRRLESPFDRDRPGTFAWSNLLEMNRLLRMHAAHLASELLRLLKQKTQSVEVIIQSHLQFTERLFLAEAMQNSS